MAGVPFGMVLAATYAVLTEGASEDQRWDLDVRLGLAEEVDDEPEPMGDDERLRFLAQYGEIG